MKRGKGLSRGKRLNADPEKVREFIQRGRAGGLSRSTGRSKEKGREKAPRSSNRPVEGPMAPAEWRNAVWRLDGGLCRSCRRAVPLDGDSWVWQAHHPIEKQKLRHRNLYAYVWDPANGIVLCKRCHDRHHDGTTWAVPFMRLPERCWSFAVALGEWAEDVLKTAHPAGSDDPPATDRGGQDGRQ